MKKKILFPMLSVATVLLFLSFMPIKKAVYVDKKDENGERANSVYQWYIQGKNWDILNSTIIEYSDENTTDPCRALLKATSSNYIGEYDEYHEIPLYFSAVGDTFFSKLYSRFAISKVKNFFAIKYYDVNGDEPAELKNGHLEKEIVITDWVPIYPIQRSGWLASRLLPKSYLTIWDFIG